MAASVRFDYLLGAKHLTEPACPEAKGVGNVVMIAKVATSEIEDITTEDDKNAAAVVFGRMGGRARAAGLSANERSAIAKKAAKTR